MKSEVRTKKLRSEYFPYGMNNWLVRALLYSHHKVVGKLIKYISLEAQFFGNQTKNVRTKSLKIFRKIFGELLVRYLQTNCESYLNKYSQFSSHTPRMFIFQNTLRFNGY